MPRNTNFERIDHIMKIFFASDIHGSAKACSAMLDAYNYENAERFILLGDLLYHGPRNPLPEQYNPKEVISLLNNLEYSPLCVRGNCDAEVDQMVLNFPIMSDSAILALDNHRIAFITHGHIYSLSNLPPMQKGDILIHGHTHVHCIQESNDITYINPGSVSMPKENQEPSYMIFDNNTFTIKQLYTHKVLLEKKII